MWEINKTIIIQAPPDAVWRALTTPAMIQEWMGVGAQHIATSWQPGTPIIFSGELHEELSYETKGEILAFEAPHYLSYTHYSTLTELPDVPENYSILSFRLSLHETHTRLTLHQENIVLASAHHHLNFYWNVALGLLSRLALSQQQEQRTQ